MKKRNGLFFALACLLISCGRHNNHNTQISYKDKRNIYSMHAHFDKNKTRAVEHFMNNAIGRKSNVSFTNMVTDATITLDDGTNFYMKKSPGELEIELDKNKNSSISYYTVKSMCEGIKEVILD
ncbi:MAG: hypothetical protein QM687_06725 [Ferruginibacter sp.]